MPYLTLQITGLGLVCDVLFRPTQPRIEALRSAGQPIPSFGRYRALVDTGASCTCIDPSVAVDLGLDATGSTPMNTASTGASPVNAQQYDITLVIDHPDGFPLFLPTIPVAEMELSMLGIEALIGRDVLDECLLIYDGKSQTFTLGY